MSRIAWVVFLLFFPASLGILAQVIGNHILDQQLIALGLLFLCIDQARMAVLDLTQVAEVQQQVQDARLDQFYKITLSTIALELLGFYLAALWLGWGIVLVLLSQIWFNSQAEIQLQPDADVTVQSRRVADRLPILITDAFGLGLIGLWMARIAPLEITLVLWGIALAYGCVKYFNEALPRS